MWGKAFHLPSARMHACTAYVAAIVINTLGGTYGGGGYLTGLSDLWTFGLVNLRTYGTSDMLTFGLVALRTRGPSEK